MLPTWRSIDNFTTPYSTTHLPTFLLRIAPWMSSREAPSHEDVEEAGGGPSSPAGSMVWSLLQLATPSDLINTRILRSGPKVQQAAVALL